MKIKNRNDKEFHTEVEEVFEQTDTGEDICPHCETAHIEHERGL